MHPTIYCYDDANSVLSQSKISSQYPFPMYVSLCPPSTSFHRNFPPPFSRSSLSCVICAGGTSSSRLPDIMSSGVVLGTLVRARCESQRSVSKTGKTIFGIWGRTEGMSDSSEWNVFSIMIPDTSGSQLLFWVGSRTTYKVGMVRAGPQAYCAADGLPIELDRSAGTQVLATRCRIWDIRSVSSSPG